MEGPSLKIIEDELAPLIGKKVLTATARGKFTAAPLVGKKIQGVETWGKHLLLKIGTSWVKIHFLMFGSYRLDDVREGRVANFHLETTGKHQFNVYSSSVSILPASPDELYDWRLDVLSPRWDTRLACMHVKDRHGQELCDVLMDQEVFAGVGNIIKNEVLFRQKLHPETTTDLLSPAEIRQLVKEVRIYCELFREWKLAGHLKRNWQVFRKKTCPKCGALVTKRATGALERISHYCGVCQPRRPANGKRN